MVSFFITEKMKFKLIIFTFLSVLISECSDLDYITCMQYPEYCEWNQETAQCQDISSDDGNNSYIEPSCIPFDQTEPIPYNTTEYADMCMEFLGVPPTIDCGEGIHIPIYVNGEDIRYLNSLSTDVNKNDEISIVPAVAGG